LDSENRLKSIQVDMENNRVLFDAQDDTNHEHDKLVAEIEGKL